MIARLRRLLPLAGSLRVRLVLTMVVMIAVALVISGIATRAALQSFLMTRVDRELQDARYSAAPYLLHAAGQDGFEGGGPGGPALQLPAGSYTALYAADGRTLLTAGYVELPGTTPPSGHPRLSLPLPNAGPDQPTFSIASDTQGGPDYRVMVMSLDQAQGEFIVLAAPLSEVQSTLDDLLLLETLVGLVVLLLVVVAAWLIIRLDLRPLERMGATAAAIAGGDLSRRVEPATPSTEIGRLGLALNSMLTQIEAAFAERTRSEQRMRRFLADASHELRTPLTSIRGYAEMLRRGAEKSPEDASVARRRIEEESVRMSALVEDLLLLARLDQGRPLEMGEVDLGRLAADSVADARAATPRRRIIVHSDESVVVPGDEARLRQAITNLVRNAVVHTPARTPIEVTVGRNGMRAVLSVVDHGPGLDPEQAARIFEPFYRADPGRSRDTGGVGLGLPIVAAVVAAHGGEVEVTATPSGGATFRVMLPLI